MTDPLAAEQDPSAAIDAAMMRRMLLHEARVHAIPGRNLRDLGDSILLHDPVEREPFWNRLEGLRWPDDPAAFDKRLTEVLVLFASIGRTPHIWASPLHDSPVDLVSRLEANGFRDMGLGNLMILADPEPVRLSVTRSIPDGVSIERFAGLTGALAEAASSAIVDVLLDAFEVDPERRPAIEGETVVSLGHPWFTHYLVRADGEPAAVARRATFEGLTYLSSIGTAGWARGRGLGTLVTRMAAADGLTDTSTSVYLGVFAENLDAIGVYERSGFEQVGTSCPDMLLW
jgi:hypothetical protein